MVPVSPSRIKREPLGTHSIRNEVSVGRLTQPSSSSSAASSCPPTQPTPTTSQNIVIIKPEPVPDEGDEDEPLSSPDPNKPKNYRRICRIPREDEEQSEDERPKMKKGRNLSPSKNKRSGAVDSDDDDDYVPLVSESVANASTSDSYEVDIDSNSPERCASTKKHIRNTRNRSSQQQQPPKPTRRGVRTRRQKAKDKESEETESELSETKSLDGFVVSDDEEVSDPTDDVSSEAEHEHKKSNRSKRKVQSKPKRSRVRTKRKRKDSSTSESDESLVQGSAGSRRKESQRGKRLPRKSQRKPGTSSSSASSSPDRKDLSNDVVSEMRSIMPTCPGVSSHRRKRNRSGGVGALLFGGEILDKDDPVDSDDSFIDNKPDPIHSNWNLESSSASDEDVVEEDPSNLELDSETEDKSESPYEDSQSEKSSSDDEHFIPRKVFEPENQLEKCNLCQSLGDIDVRRRDHYVDADEWCKCGQCLVVSPKMRNYDRLCCKELTNVQEVITSDMGGRGKCITDHTRFKKDVLHCGAFKSSKKQKNGKMDKSNSKLHEEFRRCTDKEKVIKCRQCFLHWIVDKTGWGNKTIVPSCVVAKIREKWVPSAGPLYFDPLKVTKVCQFAKHCSNAKNL